MKPLAAIAAVIATISLWATYPLAGAVVTVLVGVALLLEWKKEKNARQQPADDDLDERIDRDVERALEPNNREINQIETHLKTMPGIELLDIATTEHWEKQLISYADQNLRNELSRLGDDDNPDGHLYHTWSKVIPMTYELAYPLVQLARGRQELTLKKREWFAKQVTFFGEQRKREARLDRIAWAAQDIRDIDREMDQKEREIRQAEEALWKAFKIELDLYEKHKASRQNDK